MALRFQQNDSVSSLIKSNWKYFVVLRFIDASVASWFMYMYTYIEIDSMHISCSLWCYMATAPKCKSHTFRCRVHHCYLGCDSRTKQMDTNAAVPVSINRRVFPCFHLAVKFHRLTISWWIQSSLSHRSNRSRYCPSFIRWEATQVL